MKVAFFIAESPTTRRPSPASFTLLYRIAILSPNCLSSPLFAAPSSCSHFLLRCPLSPSWSSRRCAGCFREPFTPVADLSSRKCCRRRQLVLVSVVFSAYRRRRAVGGISCLTALSLSDCHRRVVAFYSPPSLRRLNIVFSRVVTVYLSPPSLRRLVFGYAVAVLFSPPSSMVVCRIVRYRQSISS